MYIDLFCNITNASLKPWSSTISPWSSPSIPSFSSYNRTKKRTAKIHSHKCRLTLHDGSLIRQVHNFIILQIPSFHKFVALKHFTSFSNYLHHRHHILKKYIKSLITHKYTRAHTRIHLLTFFVSSFTHFFFILFFFQCVQQKMSMHSWFNC